MVLDQNQTKKQEDYHMSAKYNLLFNKFTIKVCVWRVTPPTATQGNIIPAMMTHPVYSLLLWDSMWTGRLVLLILLSKHGLRTLRK
jgi:hypothetical protein